MEAELSEEPAYAQCPPAARLRVWAECLQGLLAEEKEQWVEEDKARYREERQRASFACLRAAVCCGVLVDARAGCSFWIA